MKFHGSPGELAMGKKLVGECQHFLSTRGISNQSNSRTYAYSSGFRPGKCRRGNSRRFKTDI